MSETQTVRQDARERRERQERTKPKKKHSIIARYKYNIIKRIETEDVGTFREMWARHKGKYEFYCADVFTDNTPTYHLNEHNLQAYGKHKAWIDPDIRVNGKPVVLVFNAGSKAKLRVHDTHVRTTDNRDADKDSPTQAPGKERKGDVRRPSNWFYCGD